MNGEYPFNTYAVRNAANGKGFGYTCALASNDDAFKSLKSFSFAFTDSDLHLNGVADFDCFGYVSLEAVLSNDFRPPDSFRRSCRLHGRGPSALMFGIKPHF